MRAAAREPASGGKKSPAKREYRKYEAVFQIIRDDLTMISDMAKHLDLRQLEEVVKVIKKAKIIDVYGTDNSANAAAELSGRMLHLGLTSRNYSDLFFQKVSAGHLGKKDVAIGFSISGETQAVIDSLTAARQAGAVTVAVTGDQVVRPGPDRGLHLYHSHHPFLGDQPVDLLPHLPDGFCGRPLRCHHGQRSGPL